MNIVAYDISMIRMMGKVYWSLDIQMIYPKEKKLEEVLDMNLVEQAIAVDEHSKDVLTAAIKEMTELDNTNSVLQMKRNSSAFHYSRSVVTV